MFQGHPSRTLAELFQRKPYQGTAPEAAQFLFVGLDANYAADIEGSPIFPSLLRYHEDGPAFWREHGVHHPFLLPRYTGDGRRYHLTFAKLGFGPEHADLVSFVELLHLPTVGRSSLVSRDLNTAHLRNVARALFQGTAKYSFVSAGVLRLMGATGLFPQVGSPRPSSGALRILYQDASRTVFLHLHFSNYGKFESRLRAEAREISLLMPCGATQVER